MNRRTLLQAAMGLFGLGAVKAVAQPEPVVVFGGDHSLYSVAMTGPLDTLESLFFRSVIGVVVRNGVLYFAMRDRFTNEWDAGSHSLDQESLDRLVEMSHRANAMLVPEANGCDGARLVDELVRRCPKRMYYPESLGVGFFHVGLSEAAVTKRLSLSRWDIGNPDEAMARYCTLVGLDALRKRWAIAQCYVRIE